MALCLIQYKDELVETMWHTVSVFHDLQIYAS